MSDFFIFIRNKKDAEAPLKYYADFRELTRPLTTALIFPFA